MADIEDNTNFLKGVLVGTLFGAIAGMLFAPKSGKKLRSDIMQKGEEALDESKRIYSDARVKADDVLNQAYRKAEELKREAEQQLTEAKSKAEELMSGAQEVLSGFSRSAKGAAQESGEQLKLSRDVLSRAVEAGIEAAINSLSRTGRQ